MCVKAMETVMTCPFPKGGSEGPRDSGKSHSSKVLELEFIFLNMFY